MISQVAMNTAAAATKTFAECFVHLPSDVALSRVVCLAMFSHCINQGELCAYVDVVLPYSLRSTGS